MFSCAGQSSRLRLASVGRWPTLAADVTARAAREGGFVAGCVSVAETRQVTRVNPGNGEFTSSLECVTESKTVKLFQTSPQLTSKPSSKPHPL